MHEEIKERFVELIKANPPMQEMERLANIAIENGNFRLEEDQESTYANAKIIWFAVLSTMAEQWLPLDRENLKTAKLLKKAIH